MSLDVVKWWGLVSECREMEECRKRLKYSDGRPTRLTTQTARLTARMDRLTARTDSLTARTDSLTARTDHLTAWTAEPATAGSDHGT